MTDRPIIFSAPMVRALLDGRKTMTRRLAWKPWSEEALDHYRSIAGPEIYIDWRGQPSPWQRVEPGDHLWVREAWRVSKKNDGTKPRDLTPRIMTTLYEAGGSMGVVTARPRDGSVRPASEYVPDATYPTARPDWAGKLRPGMFLPRWASRLTLIVTAIRIERLQDISEADARAEGCSGCLGPNPDFPDEWDPSPTEEFRDLWTDLHGADAWTANPEVVAISFKVIRENIDVLDALKETTL